MKSKAVSIGIVWAISLIWMNGITRAQVLQGGNAVTAIGSYAIELSDNKTTNIIFPYAVRSVDRGSAEVIAQTVQGFGNILQLKADVTGFKQTNVTVITSDGKFYSFLADYNSHPAVLNLSFVRHEGETQAPVKSIALPDDHYNEASLNADAANILSAKSFLHDHVTNEQMKLRLAGIYLKDGLMWFRLDLSNHSQVAFAMDNISFSTVDRKQAKRTARQEIFLHPVYIKPVETIRGNTTKELLLAFKPFTLANTRQLKIQVNEKAGGRNLILVTKAKKLLRARASK